ncbi:MAG: bifunctional phosphoribosylaminoimidazolecarboxamide formyltransferase/IMP cyclohydrolase [Oligoflexia bacterium]|nr:bifunctional phosphoribosylaminoimidazolecarboxamide formyltransferase/IMP cyclohydrolase [Oligoflexia bacterium]
MINISNLIKIKRVLISVYQKENLEILLPIFKKFNIEIYASDGTKNFISNLRIIDEDKLQSISSYTKNPAILNGKVKTISYELTASLLFDPSNTSEQEEFKNLNLSKFDMVITNLYPFMDVFKNNKHKYDIKNITSLMSYIDIGGVLLIRSAAKNFLNVSTVTDVNDYQYIIDELIKNDGSLIVKDNIYLMKKAFNYTANYEFSISNALDIVFPTNHLDTNKDVNENVNEEPLQTPLLSEMSLKLLDCEKENLKYGENSHQKANFYKSKSIKLTSLTNNTLSYNNLLDINSSLGLLSKLENFSSIIVKHNNPCGVATSSKQALSFVKAFEGDQISSFGGVVSFNTPLEMDTLEYFYYQDNGKMKNRFFEVIAAVDFDMGVIERLSKILKNVKIIKIPQNINCNNFDFRFLANISSSFLIQENNSDLYKELAVVTQNKDFDINKKAILFGLKIVKELKSNAIAIVKHFNDDPLEEYLQLVGAGTGWPNRVGAVKTALMNVEENNTENSNLILFSDGHFPFPDSIELISKYNIKTVVEPGGSIRDKEVIAKANQLNINLIFTGIRLFKH